MTDFLKRHWLGLAIAACFVYWFFSGSTPEMPIQTLLGQGKRLSKSTMRDGQNVDQSIDELVAQASAVMGRPVDRDAYLEARVSRSEHWDAGDREKALIQQVIRNDADAHGWSMEYEVTVGKGLGRQSGRRCSTALDPRERDLMIAEARRSGAIADESGGATHFVHKTGFKTVTDYQAVCDSWYEQYRIVPVDPGGVSSLRIFLPESVVQNG